MTRKHVFKSAFGAMLMLGLTTGGCAALGDGGFGVWTLGSLDWADKVSEAGENNAAQIYARGS